jgi:hypothetical protein
MSCEVAGLRSQVAQLTADNSDLQRENDRMHRLNAALRAQTQQLPQVTVAAPPAARRIGVMSSALAAADTATVAVELEADLDMSSGFLGGAEVPRDEVGTALYLQAQQLIPQGCGLISKRPETFLPEQWPTYYARAEGAFSHGP